MRSPLPSLHLRELSYAHTSAIPVVAEVDLDLVADPRVHPSTWIGVVGPNGVGKTTLLRVVAGDLAPTRGRLEVHAAGPPRLVPQEVGTLTDDVRAFAGDWDGRAQKLRARLALDPADLDPVAGRGWAALSPGQRKRWQVAAALAEDPDVLLLDEPTNHLDVAARDLLLDVLGRFDGLGLLVSHDRVVLDRLTARTLRIEPGGAVALHTGGYTEAAARWRAEDAARRERHRRAQRELRRERRLLADARRDRHGAEAGPRRERREAGAAQPDAREAGRKLAQRKAEAALARRVRQQHARVARADAEVGADPVARDHTGAVGFRHLETGRRVLASVVGDVPHAGGAVWLRDVEVTLQRGEHVHLAGPNGAGKTTLLRAVLDRLTARGEVVASLPQELVDPADEVARLRACDPALRGRVLGTVATLGVDPDRVLVTGAPSPGEARKLALARLLAADGASVLVLDEPTNHLDLPSIEHLQDAVAAWPGALLLVTHDDALAEVATTTRWDIADHRVEVLRRAG